MRRVGFGSAALFMVLCLAPRAWSGDSEWVLAASPHFKVLSADGEKSAREVARELEQTQAVVERFLNAKAEIFRPVTVIVTGKEETARRLLPYYWERKSRAEIAGAFSDSGDKYWAVVRMDTPDPTGTVRHEYVHLLIAARYGEAPLWLNEGLAEFYGSARFTSDEANVGRIEHHLLYLRRSKMLPIDTLVAVDHGSPEYEEERQAGLFYAQASVLTHYLLIGDRGKHLPRLSEYLKLIAEENVDDHTAVERAFGGSRKLLSELTDYVNRPTYKSSIAKIEFPEEQIQVRTLRPAQASALLADFFLDRGDVKSARAHLEPAIEAEPTLADLQLQYARLLAREGRMEKAAAAFAEAIRLTPSNAFAHYYAGITRGLPDSDEKAREAALRKVVELAPRYAPAHIALARLLLGADRAVEARAAAIAAVSSDPTSVSALVTLLWAVSRLERADEVAQVERWLLQRVRVDANALGALVAYYESRESPQEAEALLERVRAQSPRNLRAVRLHADFLERKGRLDEVEKVLREGLAVERKRPDLLNHLAYLNAERGVKLEEAVKLADEGLKIHPSNSYLLDTKGWALFRLGRLREAEDCVRRSLAIDEDAIVRDHLGDILDKAGRRSEALESWRQAAGHTHVDEKLKAALAAKIAKAETP